jgi:hypothetical protein
MYWVEMIVLCKCKCKGCFSLLFVWVGLLMMVRFGFIQSELARLRASCMYISASALAWSVQVFFWVEVVWCRQLCLGFSKVCSKTWLVTFTLV